MKIRTFTTDFDIVSLDFGKRGAYIVYSTLTPQGSQGRTYRIEVDHITTDTPNQVRAEAYRVRSIGRSFPGYDFTHYSTKTTIHFPLTDTYGTYREYQNPQSGTATTLKTLNPGTNETAMSTTARQPLRITDLDGEVITRRPGDKQYELTDHLGNVRFVLSDRKLTGGATGDAKGNYDAEMLSATDYYPGGSIMPGRSHSSDYYRYKYQGSESDDEIAGTGNHVTTHFRELDTRLLRWWAVDPKASSMPWESPYMSMGGNPIMNNDILGDSIWTTTKDNVTTLHFMGKVMNKSKYDIDMQEAINDITEDFNSTFEGTFENMNGEEMALEIDLQLEEAKSLNEVNSSDHLLVFSNVEHKVGNARGVVNKVGGKIAYLSGQDYPSSTSWFGMSYTNTAVHEMGHLLGLHHNKKSRWNNLMNVGADGYRIRGDQRSQIVKNTRLKYRLNKGKPYLTIPNSSSRLFDTNITRGGQHGRIVNFGHSLSR